MKNFFKLIWKWAWKILFLILVIWLILVILNFLYPNTFGFLDKKRTSRQNYYTQEVKVPLRYKIYNTFFKGSINNSFKKYNPFNMATSSGDLEKSKTSEPIILGVPPTSLNNKDMTKLNSEDLYIFPNSSQNTVAQNFRFNNLLIKENGINILSPGTIITGEINTHYLVSPYFYIYFYDNEGNYLYNISANGYIDLTNKNLFQITAIYNAGANNNNYKGDGFMVIWTDNPEVESVLISKIIIE